MLLYRHYLIWKSRKTQPSLGMQHFQWCLVLFGAEIQHYPVGMHTI